MEAADRGANDLLAAEVVNDPDVGLVYTDTQEGKVHTEHWLPWSCARSFFIFMPHPPYLFTGDVDLYLTGLLEGDLS
jgi:hypothetical protein